MYDLVQVGIAIIISMLEYILCNYSIYYYLFTLNLFIVFSAGKILLYGIKFIHIGIILFSIYIYTFINSFIIIIQLLFICI